MIIKKVTDFKKIKEEEQKQQEARRNAESLMTYKITKLAMSNRLTQEEEIAVDLASFGETTNAAAVRRFLRKLELASYIDLEREDTIAGVQMLETGGLIGVGRADEILNTPATEEERWKGQE